MTLRRLSIFLSAVLLALLCAGEARAHGMGARYFAQRLEIRLGTQWVHVVYTLEVPVSILQREFVDVARERRDVPLDDLKQDFRTRKAEEMREGLELRLNDHHLALEADPEGETEVRPNDRVFMLYRYALRAPVAEWLAAENALEIHNGNYEGRDSLYALTVDAGDGIHDLLTGLEGDERFFVDPSSETAWYPSSKHRNPTLRFRVGPVSGEGTSTTEGGSPGAVAAGRIFGSLEALFEREPRGVPGVLLALCLSFALGAAHALSPGHGKASIVAYLTGSRARAGHALVIGAAHGFTHGIVAVVLAGVTIGLVDRILPETVAHYLGLVSGGFVVGLGFWMLRRHRSLETPTEPSAGAVTGATRPRVRELLALGISGGLVPTPGAIAVLLLGLATGQYGLTLAMVLAFSLGVGGLLAGLGVAAVVAHRDLRRYFGGEGSAWAARFQLATALVVLLSGLGILARNLMDRGLPGG